MEEDGLTLEAIRRLRAMAFPNAEEQERQMKKWEEDRVYWQKLYKKMRDKYCTKEK